MFEVLIKEKCKFSNYLKKFSFLTIKIIINKINKLQKCVIKQKYILFTQLSYVYNLFYLV